MEDYRLEQSGQEVQNILNTSTPQSDLDAEILRAGQAEQALDGKIDAEETRAKAAEKQNADDIDAIEEKIPSGASSSNKFATESDVNDASQTLQGNIDAEALRAGQAEQVLDGKIDAEETRAKAAEKANADDIDAIEEKIPSGATSSNKLATEDYVNDKVATDSATFRGTYNLVSDLGLLPTATHDQIAYALSGEIATADNNDYAFVQIPTSAETPTQIAKIERYKFDGSAWAFEYELNNSGFTAAQWAAINSGITSGDVTKLAALPTSSELTTLLNGKQNTLTFDNVPTQGSNNPVKSGGVYSDIKAEEERAKAAEKANADDIDAIEEKIPSGATSSNKLATASDVTGEATTRENADAALQQAIEAILLLIPSAATALNQLADKAFVNSSIATASATFRGTYNLVNDLGLMVSATHAQIATALAGAVVDEDNNDYAFVQVPTSDATPTQIAKTERYKFNGTAWEYEYDLNNSGYTADQWAAINSGITAALVSKLSALPTNAELTTALGLLSDGIASINGKIPSEATTSNKLVDTAAMQSYVAQIINAIDATFNVGSADGHVAVQITQVNGVITNVAITTSDIASASALTLVTGRVTDAEANIVSLGGRMTTAEDDIDDLQQLYNNLQQSAPVVIEPTDTWPVAVADRSATVIYRVVDRVNTPPQYYSDYMFRASDLSGQPVLMAKYDNAINPRPKKGSQNLVTSGGVFDNMGALDVSELNATENPHTLATYADLSAALATIPSDYQKGGMSIKFIQGSVGSSDNIYKQFRYKGTAVTGNPNPFLIETNWQEVGIEEILSNEWLEVTLDKNNRVLEGINKNGEKIFNIPIKAAILDNKVDKEEGKSLINETFANGINYLQSIEWLDVVLDKNGRVLEGIDKDGRKYVYDLIIQNPTFLVQLVNSVLNQKANLIQRNKAFLSDAPIKIFENEEEEDYKEALNVVSVVKLSDTMYYMYYESDNILEAGDADQNHRLCFAYSEDGENWVKQIPDGITPPIIEDGRENQIMPTGEIHGHTVVMVPDSEYPFRMVCLSMTGNPSYKVCIYKSQDGINWEYIRDITNNSNDSPVSCIVRGNTLKIYCRERTDNTARLRGIAIINTDLDGNRFYPPINTNHELMSITPESQEKQLYQASATILDERRELLFPTIFNENTNAENVGCIIVDGDSYTNIPFNDGIVNSNDVKQIYFGAGLINIGVDMFAFYTAKDYLHGQTPSVGDTSKIMRVKVNIK